MSTFCSFHGKVEPDKGGKLVDQQRLQAARAKWRDLLQKKHPKPRGQQKHQKKKGAFPIQTSGGGKAAKAFVIRSTAVLLTYQNIPESSWDSLCFTAAVPMRPLRTYAGKGLPQTTPAVYRQGSFTSMQINLEPCLLLEIICPAGQIRSKIIKFWEMARNVVEATENQFGCL